MIDYSKFDNIKDSSDSDYEDNDEITKNLEKLYSNHCSEGELHSEGYSEIWKYYVDNYEFPSKLDLLRWLESSNDKNVQQVSQEYKDKEFSKKR